MQALRQNARDRTDHVSLRSFKCPNNSKYKPTSGIFFNVWTPWIVHTSLDTSIHLPFLTQEVLQRPKCLFKVTISRRAPSTSQSFGVPCALLLKVTIARRALLLKVNNGRTTAEQPTGGPCTPPEPVAYLYYCSTLAITILRNGRKQTNYYQYLAQVVSVDDNKYTLNFFPEDGEVVKGYTPNRFRPEKSPTRTRSWFLNKPLFCLRW